MYKAHEILGTDLPIFQKKQERHFSLEEIIHLNEDPNNYRISGYVPLEKFKEIFYEPVYSKGFEG
ncbi:hypothetical protein D3H55_23120 [Bacillus salacetis]|uniref:Uncharacterized protein n=1 Tax=Bacillus salacetis TaxID=2315464 RepID=A0A3A1QLL0_9BACI|nr:hypothetical protein [Bacillus salacetis]RIW27275.1 hypothetical protein D3H55_23120 [Bacillus salacetis]